MIFSKGSCPKCGSRLDVLPDGSTSCKCKDNGEDKKGGSKYSLLNRGAGSFLDKGSIPVFNGKVKCGDCGCEVTVKRFVAKVTNYCLDCSRLRNLARAKVRYAKRKKDRMEKKRKEGEHD